MLPKAYIKAANAKVEEVRAHWLDAMAAAFPMGMKIVTRWASDFELLMKDGDTKDGWTLMIDEDEYIFHYDLEGGTTFVEDKEYYSESIEIRVGSNFPFDTDMRVKCCRDYTKHPYGSFPYIAIEATIKGGKCSVITEIAVYSELDNRVPVHDAAFVLSSMRVLQKAFRCTTPKPAQWLSGHDLEGAKKMCDLCASV